MRTIDLSGYIDDEVWFGDEITPELLHAALYGEQNQFSDDVHIRLNSYGGSCNAATRMFDDIRAYPGHVQVTVSGTAASAATVLAMAAERLEMTPGSLFMIHDPSVLTWGNERDLLESVQLLRACKESILNMYGTRCKLKRAEVSQLMTDTCWM
ncbi:Clp protease ClpP, partial [Eubacteriales bacterium OttesenSCG-928-A19]|nr:Clp protease ClpP [Eubacteriales bacterium OttesenSCG-928-A19]